MGLSAYNPGKITGGGVTASKISYIDLSSNVYSETDAKTIGLGQAVVTPVVNDVINFDSPLYTEADMLKSSTTETAETEKKSLFEMAFDALKTTGATIVVTGTSILSGVVNLGEKALDGVVHVGAVGLSLVGLEDEAQAARDFISRDLSGELNEAFYEGIGSGINDASLLKYDSDIAKNISSYSEKAATIAAATALTVVSGGAVGPAVAGFLVGSGGSAETNYKNGGTKLSDEGQILLNGLLTAVSWEASAELGKGFVSLGKAMGESGFKATLAKVGKDLVNKDFAINALKAGSKKFMNYVNTIFYVADDIGGYFTGEREINLKNITQTTVSAAWYFISTAYITAAKGYITNEGKLKIKTSEEAESVADEFKNGNKDLTKLSEYSKEAQQEILKNMSSKDLANALLHVDNSKVPQIYNMLNTEQKEGLINTIAQDIIDKPDATLDDLLHYGNNFTGEVFQHLTDSKAAELRKSIGIDVISGKTDIKEVLKLGSANLEAIKRSLPADVQEDFVNITNSAITAQHMSSPIQTVLAYKNDIGGIIDNDSKLETIETLGDAIFGDNDIPIDNMDINGDDVNSGGGVPIVNAARI